MKTRVIILVSLFFAGITAPALAQSEAGLQKLPEGTWMLEKVSAFEADVQKPFSAADFNLEIPSEIDIQPTEIAFVRKGSTETVKYDVVVKGNVLYFPICAEWSIVEDKLQLQWIQDVEDPENVQGTLTIVLIYNRK